MRHDSPCTGEYEEVLPTVNGRSAYIVIPVFLYLWLGYRVYFRRSLIPLKKADLGRRKTGMHEWQPEMDRKTTWRNFEPEDG